MKRILVIEDETNLRNTLVDLLEINGYEVIIAQDGEEGVQKVNETHPDVVLCDVNMPKMNGFEVIDHLSNTMGELEMPPFIFLTAKSDRESTRYGMSLGAEDYITKPFNSKEVLNAIEIRIAKRNKIKRSILNKERVRMSNELHNGIQNIMVAANMGIKSILSNSDNLSPEKLSTIQRSSDLIKMAIEETRNLSHTITPLELEKKGLKKYLEKIIDVLLLIEKIDFKYESNIEQLENKQLQLVICRLIQEMITNTLKHAKANKIELSIKENENEIIINYKDNGIGFDINEVEKNNGLKNLKQKTQELKGELKMKTSLRKGVFIEVNIKK